MTILEGLPAHHGLCSQWIFNPYLGRAGCFSLPGFIVQMAALYVIALL